MATALAARHALPAIFPFREYALASGLMSYGSSLGYLHHEWGIYSGRILKGEKPEPICRSSRPLTLNLKTANALGISDRAAGTRRRGDRMTRPWVHLRRQGP
jgi:putative ABC transport system substrate-binding protein